MHPLSTALFLAGYGLALPVATRLTSVIRDQSRLIFVAHQLGIIVAGLGWILRGSMVVAVAHIVWLIAARLWFAAAGRTAPTGPLSSDRFASARRREQLDRGGEYPSSDRLRG